MKIGIYTVNVNTKLTVAPKIIAHSYKYERNLVEYAIFMPFLKLPELCGVLLMGQTHPQSVRPIKCTVQTG